MTAITDPLGAIVSLLEADADVSALIGTRIYGGELPAAQAQYMPRQCMVLQYSGSGESTTGRKDWSRHGSMRIDVWCYGKNFFEADQVRRTVHPVLKEVGRTYQGSVLLHSINHSAGPIQFRDPETKWPVVINTYSVFYAEKAIS